jgi:antitoxin ParD1/3/4
LLIKLEPISMPTRNVVLTEHLDEVIDQLVETGRYQNASEVLRDGLRMVEQREAREKAKLAALKEAAAIGFRDIEEGRFQDVGESGLEEFMNGLGQRASKRVKTTGR